MEYPQNFDKQNYDESIVDYRSTYIKETFRERKISMENFDKSPIICKNLLDFSTVNYLH